jgi:UTP--glucose-1-phosphate uridylyltransferase
VLGRYVLPAKILDILEHTTAGVGGEIQLTDALDRLIETDSLNIFETSASTYDCGNKQGFLGANLAVGLRDPKTKDYLKAMLSKITL